MCRKGENIRKRKDGRWEARIILTDENGNKKSKSLYAKTYTEAKRKLLKEKINYSNTIYSCTQKTFSKIAREWLLMQSKRQKESTILKYNNVLNKHLLPYFGETDIKNINEIFVNMFFSQKIASGNLKTNKSLSSSYVKLIFVIFTSIIDYSITMNYRDELRKSLLIKLSTTKITIKILSPAEQIHLINHISNNITPTGIGIAMSLYAGLRIGEICALKWENVSLDDRTINIKHTVSRIMNNDNSKQKTKLVLSNPKTDASRRSIPINSILLEFLIKFKKMSVSNYVISLNETFVSPRTFEYRYQYRYQKLLAEYNISPINFHALRHTFATRCVEAGVDIKTLSELLGHSNVNFTLNTYVHSSVERKRSQIEKITSLDV